MYEESSHLGSRQALLVIRELDEVAALRCHLPQDVVTLFEPLILHVLLPSHILLLDVLQIFLQVRAEALADPLSSFLIAMVTLMALPVQG